MKKTLRSFAWTLGLSGLFLGCVDAENLPTKPNEPGITLTSNVSDWRDEVIYQLIVDRFHNGDINNDFNVDTRSMSRYHGGDWQGIIDKLDYLQELGVTTLWISPVVKNVEEDAGFASYHGYWTVDFLKHNPHFGDLTTLRRLSDELHKRGMKLIIDIVTNHVGQVFFYDINMNGQPNEWLAGSGEPDKGSGRAEGEIGGLSRVTEYDPDFNARGIDAYTSMGISGKAPIVFFDMPSINRVAPGPTNIDLDGDGQILTEAERLGFSNPNWYHQKGRTFDYDKPVCENKPCVVPLYNYDGTRAGYVDGPEGGNRKYYQNDQTLLGDFPGGLKDVATERNDVREAMIQVFSYWIDATDCDGFRIDTLKHVEYSFWEKFAPAIRRHAASRGKKNFFMFGEAFDGNDDLLAAYTQKDQVDSVFLFSQKYAIDQAFKCAPGNQANHCKGASNGTNALYSWNPEQGSRINKFNSEPQPGGAIDASGQGVAPKDLLVNFLDNHDVGRYLFDRGDEKGVDSLKNALSFLFTTVGIPCVYYGTEQGFMGGNDPANREDMFDVSASIFKKNPKLYSDYKAWDTGNPIFKHIQKLTKVRSAIQALRYGKLNDNVWHTDRTSGNDAGIYAFVRTYNDKSVLVVVNTNEAQESSTKGDMGDGLMGTPWASNTKLVDVLNMSGDNQTFTTQSTTGNPSGVLVTVPSMTTRILIPESDRGGYGL